MLVSHDSRQQLHKRRPQNLSSSSLSSPSHLSANQNFFSNLAHSTSTPSPSESTGKPHSSYLDATSSSTGNNLIYNTSNIDPNDFDLYMPQSLDFGNQHYSHLLTDGADNNVEVMWELNGTNASHGVANHIGMLNRAGQSHQRAPSGSSIGSTISLSPFQGTGQSQRVIGQQSRRNPKYSKSQSSRSHLPTPTATPTRPTFATSPAYSQPQDINSSLVAAHLNMNQALLDPNQHPDDDLPQMSHSNRPSFSSMGQHDPATPRTIMSDHQDESQRSMHTDSMSNPLVPVPKLHRTVTDAINDNLYFPQPIAVSQPQQNANYLMPTGANNLNERLMEAQMARSASSGSNQSGAVSPFRNAYGRDSEAHDSRYEMSPQESEPKTISPKDAMLDYKPAAEDYPLFPQTTSNIGESYAAVAPIQRQYTHQNAMGYGMPTSQAWGSNLGQVPMTTAPLQSYSTFATPSLPSQMAIPTTFMGTSMGQPARRVSGQANTPEFPATLTSMESSASEAAPPSSAASSSMVLTSPKPESAADSGTYSCTYHGCMHRFTTPQKLQKHKRDAHRNNPHVTPGVGSGMSASQLMERNSQSGPHKCERINPTTGKPCNAIFSRPYDLTRHEDTIHNVRKQKVRCAICTEEKTFSRADALTRHMRVVHPEVDFPGKHSTRRKSRDE